MFIKDFTGKYNNLSLFVRIAPERVLFDKKIVGYAVILSMTLDPHSEKVLFCACTTQHMAHDICAYIAKNAAWSGHLMSINELIELALGDELPVFDTEEQKVMFINNAKARRMMLEPY